MNHSALPKDVPAESKEKQSSMDSSNSTYFVQLMKWDMA